MALAGAGGANEGGEESGTEQAGASDRRALEALPTVDLTTGGNAACSHRRGPPSPNPPLALAQLLSVSLRLVAGCQVRSGQQALAESFLCDAAGDAPGDANTPRGVHHNLTPRLPLRCRC